MPVIPFMKATGTKIARNTSVVATMGAVMSFMARTVAERASAPSRSMTNCTRSTTRMASSTTVPITRMKPNSVRMLRLYPRASSPASANSRDTGMAATGTRVVLQLCRNR